MFTNERQLAAEQAAFDALPPACRQRSAVVSYKLEIGNVYFSR